PERRHEREPAARDAALALRHDVGNQAGIGSARPVVAELDAEIAEQEEPDAAAHAEARHERQEHHVDERSPRMNGRRRPMRLDDRSDSAPASGVMISDSSAPIGGMRPLNNSFLSGPTIAAIWLGRTMASRAPQ